MIKCKELSYLQKPVSGIICRDILELWLMRQIFEDYRNVVIQNHGTPPFIQNEVTAFLNWPIAE